MFTHAKKIIVITLALLLLLTACTTGQSSQQTTAAAPQTTAATSAAEPASLYPYKNAPKLTYWVGLDSKVAAVAKSLNETEFAKDLIAQTGIEVEFIQPAVGQENEQFNILVAGGDMTDIVEHRWLDQYPGGPAMAFKANQMLPLNSYLDELAPDFVKYLKDHPDVDKATKTDDGDYYGFPFIRGDISVCVFQGPIVRQDWLDDLNIPEPETIDDWTEMLRRFKNEKGATAPFQGEVGSFTASSGAYPYKRGGIVGAYGTSMDYFLDPATQTIKYGPYEPGFKEFIVQMNAWYKEGLMGQNWVTDIKKDLNALILNGETGVTINNAGGGIGTYDAAFASAGDTTAKLSGLKYPVLKKGDIAEFGHVETPIAANAKVAVINPKISEDKIKAAVVLLNYGYSEAGDRLYNYGKEGVSYNMDNGYPRYTDVILNPAQNSRMENLALYGRASYNGPFAQSKEYFEQITSAQNQLDAIAKWTQTNALAHAVPMITPSEDESKDYNRIKQELEQCLDEWTAKAITGDLDPETTYDAFIDDLKKIGVERALEIQNAAYKRYLAR